MKKIINVLTLVITLIFIFSYNISLHAEETFNADDYYIGEDLSDEDVNLLINSTFLDNYGNESGTAEYGYESYKLYCDLCDSIGFKSFFSLRTSSNFHYENISSFRPQSLDNYISLIDDEEDYLIDNHLDGDEIKLGNVEFGYFISQKSLLDSLSLYVDDDLWDYQLNTDVYNDIEISYDEVFKYASTKGIRPAGTFKYNSGATNFIYENAFYVKSSVMGVIKLVVGSESDATTFFAAKVDNDMDDIVTYNVNISNETKEIYVPIYPKYPVVFGFQHGSSPSYIKDIKIYSAGYNTGYQVNYLNTPLTTQSDLNLLSDIADNNYREGQSNGYAEGQAYGEELHKDDYSNGYAQGQEYGESLHVNDYQNGYTAGQEYGESLHVNDYQNGYTAGQEYGESLHVNDYSNGYTEGYETGYDEGLEKGYDNGHASGYTEGYNKGYSDRLIDDTEVIYNNGYEDGYSDGYDEGYIEGSSVKQNNDVIDSNNSFNYVFLLIPVLLIFMIAFRLYVFKERKK